MQSIFCSVCSREIQLLNSSDEEQLCTQKLPTIRRKPNVENLKVSNLRRRCRENSRIWIHFVFHFSLIYI